MTVGSSRPLEDAWRVGQVGMVTWLGELYGLDPMDAYQLLSQIAAGAARQRRRRQLQRRGQGSQGTAARRRRPTAGCTRDLRAALPSTGSY